MCIAGRTYRLGIAQARVPSWIGVQHRSEGRTGPWLAAGYALCFPSERKGQQDVYTIRHLGIDIDVTRGGTLFWAFFARNGQVGRGTLRGSYVGPAATLP